MKTPELPWQVAEEGIKTLGRGAGWCEVCPPVEDIPFTKVTRRLVRGPPHH